MNVLNWLASRLGEITGWVLGFWDSFLNVGLDLLALAYGEVFDMALTVVGSVSMPDVLVNFQWPDAGPLGPLFRACGLPEALAILAACWGLKLLLKFTVILG